MFACRIKSKTENQRRAEERRMRETAERQEPARGEGACETLAQLKLEERRGKKVKENQQRNKECVRYGRIPAPRAGPGVPGKGGYFIPCRYVEALRARMREKIKLNNIDLPPLCSCGPGFWDSHPDTCANNCVFYKNPKGRSSRSWRGGASARIPGCTGRNGTWLEASAALGCCVGMLLQIYPEGARRALCRLLRGRPLPPSLQGAWGRPRQSASRFVARTCG